MPSWSSPVHSAGLTPDGSTPGTHSGCFMKGGERTAPTSSWGGAGAGPRVCSAGAWMPLTFSKSRTFPGVLGSRRSLVLTVRGGLAENRETPERGGKTESQEQDPEPTQQTSWVLPWHGARDSESPGPAGRPLLPSPPFLHPASWTERAYRPRAMGGGGQAHLPSLPSLPSIASSPSRPPPHFSPPSIFPGLNLPQTPSHPERDK